MFVTPMKAAAIERLPADTDRWIMQPKLDGWRVIAGVSHDGTAWLETSTGNRIHSVPYINQALEQAFPPNTVLDGEISDEHATRTRSWNRTQTILSRDAVHRPSADDLPLTFAAFDCLIREGQDLMPDSLAERLQALVELFVMGKTLQPDLCQVDPVTGGIWAPLRMLEVLPVDQAQLDRLLGEGYEGVVVKDVTTRYVQGGRSGEWRKLKPDHEIEGLCTGTYEPTRGSKYDGIAVGGITFRITHEDGRSYDGRCAGMTDALRQDLYLHPERYEGRVVEITHKGVTADGALRHPQLRRFRDPADKSTPVAPTPVDVTTKVTTKKRVGTRKRTATEAITHADGSVTIQSADPNTGNALAEVAAKLAAGTRTPPAKRQAVPRGQIVEHGSGTRGPRVMRNYRAMKDKLRSVYEELKAGPGHEAYDRCVERGSGDPRADLAECERLLRDRGLL
jgi:ATP-dependent DNA ligase